MWRRLQLWLFYRWFPSFRGPIHPHFVGTDNVERAWRFARDIGIAEALNVPKRCICVDGWEGIIPQVCAYCEGVLTGGGAEDSKR